MADNNTNELDALMISELPTQATANETDLFEVAIVDANSASGYASKKESAAAIADAIVGEYQYPLRITGTTAKTIAGAINELKNLVDLLPQFAIEVVQTLPVSDISTTTIYLVPAQDPEQGNYYEEYIYVNNAWELVGTTAVDLSGYYTSAQVDTLLAAKANTSSLATVATSGAYSDLSGKPTIDTALDDTSTNAVENRAVASEINSIKSDITVEGSASGDIATFVDGSANPLKELKISIVATQSGSGDPSPENVRPITGWTGANICTRNFNMWDEEWESGYYLDDGTPDVSSTRIRCKNRIAVKPSTTYYLYAGGSNNYELYIIMYDSVGAYVRKQLVRNTMFTTFSNVYSLLFYVVNVSAYNHDISINYPSTKTNYHAHAGTKTNIDWEDEAGTVYGGTLDVKTGELTVTHLIIDMGDIEWGYYTSGNYPYFIGGVPNDNIHHVTNDMLMCSCYKVLPARTAGNFREFDYDKCITIITSQLPSHRIGVQDSDYTDPTAFKTAVAGQKIVYPLATPVTYQLTPTEIRSLLGTNNVFADCGAITELKYTRDLNLCINDIIARIEALEGGSNSRSLSVSPTLTKSLTSELDTTEGILEGKTEETEEETKEEAQNER